eukprot:Hpha_TRINITY_DN15445_c0_g5::TRINITY_DN15445_c0_g5_i1::g.175084::m.175084
MAEAFDDREIAEQLARHDKVLQDYRSRFEEHKQWLYSSVQGSGSPGGEPSADLVSPGRPGLPVTHTPAQPSQHAARSEHRDPSPDRSYLQEDERMRSAAVAAQQREAAAAAAQQQSREQSQQQYFRRANPKVKGHPLRVYDRVTQWQRRREQHLSEMRQQREQQELTSCTFTPTTRANAQRSTAAAPSRTAWDATPSSNIYGGDGKAWGFHEFVERQREARRRSKEGSDTAFCTGKKWKNEITVPQEFNLGRRDRAIRSLQKPLSPPACVASVHEHHHLAQEISAGLPKDSPLQQMQEQAQGGYLPRSGLFSERISAKIIDHAMMSQNTDHAAPPPPADGYDEGSRQRSGNVQQGHFSSQYGHFSGSSQGSPGFR